MFPPLPGGFYLHDSARCRCMGLGDRPCGEPGYIRIGVEGGSHDLCRRHWSTYKRRYYRARWRYYQAVMDGKIATPMADGGVFVIGA